MSVKKQERVKLCKHLRSKESFHSETPFVEDEFHSGIYWCNLTNKGIGPDGECADVEECSTSRGCYER